MYSILSRVLTVQAGRSFLLVALAVLLVITQQLARGSADKQVTTGQGVVLSYSKNGFSPASITRPAGTFAFLIFARGLPAAPVFHLDRDQGSRLKEMNGQKGQIRAGFVVDLTPGTYVLTDAANPGVQCKVIVTAK